MSSGPYAASQRAGQPQLAAVGPAVEVAIAVGTEVGTEERLPAQEPDWAELPELQEPWHLQTLGLGRC